MSAERKREYESPGPGFDIDSWEGSSALRSLRSEKPCGLGHFSKPDSEGFSAWA